MVVIKLKDRLRLYLGYDGVYLGYMSLNINRHGFLSQAGGVIFYSAVPKTIKSMGFVNQVLSQKVCKA